jgi:hypothetical protein
MLPALLPIPLRDSSPWQKNCGIDRLPTQHSAAAVGRACSQNLFVLTTKILFRAQSASSGNLDSQEIQMAALLVHVFVRNLL